MNLVVFGSGTGTILKALLNEENQNYCMRALFSDRECCFQSIGKEYQIPVITLPFKKQVDRLHYDAQIVQALKPFEPIDLILLAGYMRIVHAPLLNRYKMINVHPADLTRLKSDGTRRFTGMNSVFQALKEGEKATCSSVILVDQGIDTGKILTLGPKVPYTYGLPVTKEKAKKHQEKQKKLSDIPAVLQAIQSINKE